MKKSDSNKETVSFLENDFYHKKTDIKKRTSYLLPRRNVALYRLTKNKARASIKALGGILQAKFWLAGMINLLSVFFLLLFALFNAPFFLGVSLFFDGRLANINEFIDFSEKNKLKPNLIYMIYILFSKGL